MNSEMWFVKLKFFYSYVFIMFNEIDVVIKIIDYWFGKIGFEWVLFIFREGLVMVYIYYIV